MVMPSLDLDIRHPGYVSRLGSGHWAHRSRDLADGQVSPLSCLLDCDSWLLSRLLEARAQYHGVRLVELLHIRIHIDSR